MAPGTPFRRSLPPLNVHGERYTSRECGSTPCYPPPVTSCRGPAAIESRKSPRYPYRRPTAPAGLRRSRGFGRGSIVPSAAPIRCVEGGLP